MGVEIRPITKADWPGLWPIIETVTRAGETYTYPLDMDDAQARAMWTPPRCTKVARSAASRCS